MMSKQTYERIGAGRKSFSAWRLGLVCAAALLANGPVTLAGVGWGESGLFRLDVPGLPPGSERLIQIWPSVSFDADSGLLAVSASAFDQEAGEVVTSGPASCSVAAAVTRRTLGMGRHALAG